MTYVIAEPCVDVKNQSCVDVCPVSCIYIGDEAADRRNPSSRSWAEAISRGIRPSSRAAARSRSRAIGASLI